MDNSRTGNTKRILASGLLNRLINTFLPFINRTIIIYTLGSEFTGLTGLFSSILHVLSLAEFGFNLAVVGSLYEPLAADDTNSINQIMSWLRQMYHIVGAVIIISGLIATPFITLFIHGSYPDSVNIYILFLLYLTNSGISYYLFAYQEAILIADQKKDVTTNIKSVVTILMNLMQIIALLVFRNFYFYVILMIVGTVASNLLINHAVRKRYPHLKTDAHQAAIPSPMRKQLVGLLINRLSNVSRNAFDSLIISSTLGLTSTAMYGNYYMVYSAVFGFTSIVSNSMQASVGNSIAVRSTKENFENLLDFSLLYSWIVGWCAVSMACLYQPFMKLWVGEKLMLSNGNMFLFVLYFYLINMNHIRNQYILGNLFWWELKTAYLAEAIGNLVLNIILGKLLGITGVILATNITIFFCNYLMCNAVLFKNYFQNKSIRLFYKQQFIYLFIALLATIATWFLCVMTDRIWMKAMICLLVPNLIFAVLYRCCSRWNSSMKYVKGIIRR